MQILKKEEIDNFILTNRDKIREANLSKNRNSDLLFVRWDADRLVGFCYCCLLGKEEIIISFIQVSNRVYRMGIGSRLLSDVKEYAMANRIYKITAWCIRMRQLRSFWSKNGFMIEEPMYKSLQKIPKYTEENFAHLCFNLTINQT